MREVRRRSLAAALGGFSTAFRRGSSQTALGKGGLTTTNGGVDSIIVRRGSRRVTKGSGGPLATTGVDWSSCRTAEGCGDLLVTTGVDWSSC